jgi:AraC-like DNA-binding protein
MSVFAILVYAIVAICFVYLISKVVMNNRKRKFTIKQEQLTAGRLHEMGEMLALIHENANQLLMLVSQLENIHETVSAPSPAPASVREFHSVQYSIPLAGNIQLSSLDEEFICKTIRFIEEQIATPGLSVERLSREMAMSRTNFYKKILSITGKTPLELIRSIRMKYAARLLENSQMRVSEVALQVGVNDNKLFRKYFKEEFGILPSELYGKSNSHYSINPKNM